MSHGVTRRSHYNPCFWTALWNNGYFELWRAGQTGILSPRRQIVFALNVRANKVVETAVENAHFDKLSGVANISPASMRDFCLRKFPDKYEEWAKDETRFSEALMLDFEDFLMRMEGLQTYSWLLKAAKIGGLESVEHKGMLLTMLVIHSMRGYEFTRAMIEHSRNIGIEKWEYFWELRNAWSNPVVLARAVTPLALGRWTFWRAGTHRFPLCDSPVMISRDSMMAIVSPRLLLEVELNVDVPGLQWVIRDEIRPEKYNEFRQRAIENTFREILFHERDLLEEWQSSPEFAARVSEFGNPTSAKACIDRAAMRVMWGVLGFGRVPDEFESWVKRYFES